MTPANPDALADAPYVLLKRGLFERPGHHGYTGVLRHAGRFSHEEASAYAVHGGSVTMMLASEAPAYSPACWHETQVEDLLDLLRIEREAKAAAEARAAQLQAEVEALKEDAARLDFLDGCNARLNASYGTHYGWKLVLNHNVNRLVLGDMKVDLHDSEGGNDKLPSCRLAIDAARAADPSENQAGDGVMARIVIDVRDDGTEGIRFIFRKGLKFSDGEVAVARAAKSINTEIDRGSLCPAAKQVRSPWSFDMASAPRDGTPVDLWCYGRRRIDYFWDTEGRLGGWWSDVSHKDLGWRDREHVMPSAARAWRLSDAPPSTSGEDPARTALARAATAREG